MNEMLKIVIAEPSDLIRKGLVALLKQIPKLKLQIIESSNMEELPFMLKNHAIDMLFINPAYYGFDVGKKLRNGTQSSHIKMIALVYHPVDDTLTGLYDDSFSLYDTTQKLERLVTAFQKTEEPAAALHQSLSTREQEVIACIVKGMTNKEMAEKLFVSSHTIITHRRNIAKKLQIHSTAGLTIYAIVNKLVRLEDISTEPNTAEFK